MLTTAAATGRRQTTPALPAKPRRYGSGTGSTRPQAADPTKGLQYVEEARTARLTVHSLLPASRANEIPTGNIH